MDEIMQGTTPSLILEVDPNDMWLTSVTKIEVYLTNGGKIVTYTQDDIAVDTEANTITKHFSEEETASFSRKHPVVVQARFWTENGQVVGTHKASFDVADMLTVGD